MKTVLMKRTWTAMANCAPYAKRIYSFICSLNCYRNMMHKKFFETACKGSSSTLVRWYDRSFAWVRSAKEKGSFWPIKVVR